MSNEQIIFTNQLELLEKGLIKTTGRYINVLKADGTTEQIAEPEAIHTFAEWKKAGYMVRRGEKSIARFNIWMFKTPKKAEQETPEETTEATTTITIQVKNNSDFYMKEACFFSASQVEKIA